jgi:two-component system, OmpR family, flagellar system response regulator FtcR
VIVIVDSRLAVAERLVSAFNFGGFSSTVLQAEDFEACRIGRGPYSWQSIEGVVIGRYERDLNELKRICHDGNVPVIALCDNSSSDDILKWFQCGVDDVVREPFHDLELLARMGAVRRRFATRAAVEDGLRVFADGRDILIFGKPFKLPRREKLVLEFLAFRAGRWLSRTQVFDAVYDSEKQNEREAAIEVHISRVRKKLKAILGYDPIKSERFLGYQFVGRPKDEVTPL